MSSSGALTGILVVDTTEALAGPYCGMLLGDLGADVIKVERPGAGDQARGWGPPFVGGESAYFLSVNRNKRSIELDIKAPDDNRLLCEIVSRADVFITNNPRMESLQRAGLHPDTLRAANEGLIYTAISGYGHSGPKVNRGGYDIIAQGEAGLMALTGPRDGGPSRFPSPMADISGGIYATIATLSALYARDRRDSGTAKGAFLDISLVDAQTTWLANLAGSYFATGQSPLRLGNAHPTVTPYQPVRTKDKIIIVAVGNERLWERFCRVLQASETLQKDPRFATNADRNEHRPELIAEIEKIMVGRSSDEWIDALVDAGIPAGPINFPEDTLTDEHIRARGMIVELEHPLIGVVRSLGMPFASDAIAPTYRLPPPTLGQHNEEIRAQFG